MFMCHHSCCALQCRQQLNASESMSVKPAWTRSRHAGDDRAAHCRCRAYGQAAAPPPRHCRMDCSTARGQACLRGRVSVQRLPQAQGTPCMGATSAGAQPQVQRRMCGAAAAISQPLPASAPRLAAACCGEPAYGRAAGRVARDAGAVQLAAVPASLGGVVTPEAAARCETPGSWRALLRTTAPTRGAAAVGRLGAHCVVLCD